VTSFQYREPKRTNTQLQLRILNHLCIKKKRRKKLNKMGLEVQGHFFRIKPLGLLLSTNHRSSRWFRKNSQVFVRCYPSDVTLAALKNRINNQLNLFYHAFKATRSKKTKRYVIYDTS